MAREIASEGIGDDAGAVSQLGAEWGGLGEAGGGGGVGEFARSAWRD